MRATLPVALPSVARHDGGIGMQHSFVRVPQQPPERGAFSRRIVRFVADKRALHRGREKGRTRAVLDADHKVDVEKGDVD